MHATPSARLAVIFMLALAVGCQNLPERTPTGPTGPGGFVGPGETAVFVGAGDIANCEVPGAEATARLLDDIPGTVFAAGDNAYFQGTREDYQRCYEPTWGRHRRRTRPVPGNHEYETPGAAGYFGYFGAAAAPASSGFYSFDLGAWHVVALNSNIPMDSGSEQAAWLRADLAANGSQCTLAFVHHPLFSSGVNGAFERLRPLWDLLYAANADVVIAAHDHIYERFSKQDPAGRPDTTRGLRQFVVGTGGTRLTAPGAPRPNSEIRFAVWGVLKLTLRASDYSWEFIPVAGESLRDSGVDGCH